jgi:hypothetical protein
MDVDKNIIIMTLTKIDEYELMYSANKFSPRIWFKKNKKFIGQLVFLPWIGVASR